MIICSTLILIFCGIYASCFRDGDNHDRDLTTPQIIRRHGYPSETHIIVTEDGYLLTLHRIPHGRHGYFEDGKKVVYLQHGLLSSSSDWIINGPENSLAYILADNNYDVWMGNVRGNTYSRAHIDYDDSDLKFWNFTWHEMAVYDLPAAMDYILEKVNQQKIFYIGHSMGTTMFFAMMASKPQYNAKIQGMFALAPVVYMNHIKSPIRLLAPWANDFEFIAKYFGHGSFLPNNKVMKALAKYGCDLVTTEKYICSNIIFVLCGFDRSQFNMTLLPLILAHAPAGTSTKTLVHYTQEMKSGKFRQFDYNTSGNLVKYGTPEPPMYNLSQISAPISLHYSDNDWLASQIDVERFYKELKNPIGKFLVNYHGFNHVDFIWAKDVKTLVYDKILKILKSLYSENSV